MKKLVKKILPNKIVSALLNIRKKLKPAYAVYSYSQEGEDMVLRRIMENRLKDRAYRGFYIDAGALHPVRFSNTYFFYKKGWSGINIDAMPGSMVLFDKLRPNDVNLERAVSDQPQELNYYIFNEPALNTFSKVKAESLDGHDGYNVKEVKKIETSTLTSILDEFLPPGQSIDFLSIDVEGLDYQVLKSLNLKKYRPDIILVEILGSDMRKIIRNEITEHLEKSGYLLYAKTANTAFFLEKNFFTESD